MFCCGNNDLSCFVWNTMAPGRWRLIQRLTSPDSYSHNGSLFYLLQRIATNWMKKGKQIEIQLYVSKQTVIKWAGWTFIYISTGFEPSPFWESKKVWLIIFLFGLLCISLLSIVTKRTNAGKLQATLICCFWPAQKQDKLEMSCKFQVWYIPSSGLHTQRIWTRWRKTKRPQGDCTDKNQLEFRWPSLNWNIPFLQSFCFCHEGKFSLLGSHCASKPTGWLGQCRDLRGVWGSDPPSTGTATSSECVLSLSSFGGKLYVIWSWLWLGLSSFPPERR